MFNYFSVDGIDKFTFYRLPKKLVIGDQFRELSCEAKIFYGLLIDRASLSKKNQWVDENKHIYVYFKLDELMELLNIGKNKAISVFKELDDIGLMRDFRAEEYITECKLYTNVKQIRTFDEAIRYILGNQDYSASRLEFYNTLLNAELPTHGNHQTYQSPLPSSFSSLIADNKIYNSYGYDMQAWNTTHCSLEKHHGLDIKATEGTNVLAMITGTVESIDTTKHTITLVSDDIAYWYDDNKNRKTEINYVNVNISSSLSVGSAVNAGDVIGTVSNYKHCNGDFDNSSASSNYLHISVQIKKGFEWFDVDPRFLIYLD